MASFIRPSFVRPVSKFVFPQLRRMAGTSAKTSAPLVVTDTVEHVFLVGINRPEKRNCVNLATAAKLAQAFDEFEENPDLWVAVLYGKGGTFCAGYDLGELSTRDQQVPLPASASEAGFGLELLDKGRGGHFSAGLDLLEVSKMEKETERPQFYKALEEGRGPMGPSRKMFTKPVIAAVSGYAVAGGLELALMCDMRVADESATFGVFCRRFGVPLIDGGTVRLPQLIGLSRALDMILTGRPVSGKEALDFGLANRLVKDGTAVGEAVKLARTLCKFPQECMRADRRSAFNSTFDAASLKDAFSYEWENGKEIIAKESIEGAGEFVSGVGRGGSFQLKPRL